MLVVSRVLELRDWARERHVPLLRSLRDRHRDAVAVPTFDYLFSIVNGEIWDDLDNFFMRNVG